MNLKSSLALALGLAVSSVSQAATELRRDGRRKARIAPFRH